MSQRQYGTVDLSNSSIQLFSSVTPEKQFEHHFYLQLKDPSGNDVDCDPDEISLKSDRAGSIAFSLERLSAGRYYLSLEKNQGDVSQGISLIIQGQRLKKQFLLRTNVPDKKHTKITLVKNDDHVLTFRLYFRDKSNLPVELPEAPEILMDGHGMIEGLNCIQDGVWEFSVIYPDQIQIMYFSVRAMGVFFSKIHRYQHVEK